MAANALVSVVLPVYNGARHVGQTLRSVFEQTHRAIDVIVVDDGSSDDTLEVIAAGVGPLRLIRRHRSGVAAARNAGLQAARGELVCFLDQDDLWHPQHLAQHLRCLARHPEAGVVVSPYRHWYPKTDDEAPPAAWLEARHGDAVDPECSGWVYHRFLLDCWALTSATTIRREVLAAYGAFDPDRPYGEDWELWLRLARQVPFVRLEGPAVLYRQHAVQGSRVARPVDYRTELLLQTARAHGLASRDGRNVKPREFRRNLSRYEMEFGCDQLSSGNSRLGVRALLRAWRRDPMQLRCLALATAASLGWRPQRGDPARGSPQA